MTPDDKAALSSIQTHINRAKIDIESISHRYNDDLLCFAVSQLNAALDNVEQAIFKGGKHGN